MINAATFLPSSEELSYFTRSGPSARSADGPPKWIPFGSKIHRSKDLADVRAMAQQPQEKKVGARRTECFGSSSALIHILLESDSDLGVHIKPKLKLVGFGCSRDQYRTLCFFRLYS
jgi:hypothetical protein